MNNTRQRYFETARTWAMDMESASRRQLSLARWLAAGATAVAILEALALLMLTPLKTVVPIPVLVDRQTGFTQVLRSDGSQQLPPDAALTRALIAQYVSSRESFDIMSVRLDYHKVALWSAGEARDSYLQLMPASNPNSPFRLHPRTTIVETLIKSVSPTGPGVALVRFATRVRDQNGATSQPQSWVANVTYKFTAAPMTAADRLMNPLGFEVTRYRKDPEVLVYPDGDAPPPSPPQAPPHDATATAPPATAAPVQGPAPAPGGAPGGPRR